MKITFIVQHITPVEKRKPTIYETLKARLNREPTHNELKVECLRIIRAA